MSQYFEDLQIFSGMNELFLKTLFSLLMLSVTSLCAWGFSEARLIGQSSSGQTALFNLGTHDGLKSGEYAVIVKEIRNLKSRDLRIIPVARARNVKTNPDSSVWILYKIFDPELLVKNDKFLILSESVLLKGRRDPRMGRVTVVGNKNSPAKSAQQILNDDKDRNSKLKHKYLEGDKMHEKESRSDSEVDLVDVDGWEKQGGANHRSALYKSPYAKEFQHAHRLASFEKLVTAYLHQVNNPDFSYDKFYDEQRKSEFSVRNRSNFATEYENFLASQKKATISETKLYRSLLEKGETWSTEFSDEELRGTLESVSVLQERDRRDYVVSKPNRYTTYFDYGVFLTDPQTSKDSAYQRERRYTAELEFEFVPMIKHETLERFTFDFAFRSNQNAFETNSRNASLDEYSLAGGANWYPLYAPYIVEAPVLFFGTYIRSGFADVVAPGFGEKGRYTVLSLPGFRGGMKYNFKNNLGLRIVASMETLQIERFGKSKTTTNLPDQASIVEGKMGIGFAYSF